MNWEIVMGLEVHAELLTKSKIFCGCANSYGAEPNTLVCPVCSGMPGTLPKLNGQVVEYALKTGLALNCSIMQNCKFDRKNYFYPDLPKAYQISQLYEPICRNGHLEIDADGQKKRINIREIHIEEDAGKLTHDTRSGKTLMDFNRCGVPLLEIVTEPDLRSADEVIAYLEKLREILLYLSVCDCKMQEGSMRADINISVRKAGGLKLGTRCEMKNLNSFKAISRAIKNESARQIEILENGGQIIQETRRWDDDKCKSYGMRSKENAHDYRYFPEPDLLPLEISGEWLLKVKQNLPELAAEKRKRYTETLGISESEAVVLTAHKNISALFEELCEKSGEPLESAHLITGEIMRLMNDKNILPENLSIDADKLSALIILVCNKKINRSTFKETAAAVFTSNVNPETYISEKGLMLLNDDGAVVLAIDEVLQENAADAADFRAGKEKVFGFLIGKVMKKLNGRGNPDAVRKLLREKL